MTKINKTSFVAYSKRKLCWLNCFLYFQRLMPDTHILEYEMGIFKSNNEFYMQGNYIYQN